MAWGENSCSKAPDAQVWGPSPQHPHINPAQQVHTVTQHWVKIKTCGSLELAGQTMISSFMRELGSKTKVVALEGWLRFSGCLLPTAYSSLIQMSPIVSGVWMPGSQLIAWFGGRLRKWWPYSRNCVTGDRLWGFKSPYQSQFALCLLLACSLKYELLSATAAMPASCHTSLPW